MGAKGETGEQGPLGLQGKFPWINYLLTAACFFLSNPLK